MIKYRIDLGPDLAAKKWTGEIRPIAKSRKPSIAISDADGGTIKADFHAEYGYVTISIAEYRNHCESEHAGGRNLNLLATFKQDESGDIVLSERSTAANVYAFAQFLKLKGKSESPAIHADDREASLMWGMRRNFVHTDGRISPVIRKSPNRLETNSYAMLNSLGNLLYHSIADTKFYRKFLKLAGGGGANSLIGALHQMVKEPWDNAHKLYDHTAVKPQVFQPSLPELEMWIHGELEPQKLPRPNNWTLAVKFNDSGSQNFLIGGPANFAFDKYDRMWIPNNATQGTPNSSSFCIVLNPDGSPADISPIFGGGILGCGFGVCADAKGENIWFGNYGWGPVQYNPQIGSVSQFKPDGRAVSPSDGWTNKLSRVQGLGYDPDGNLWISSWGTQEPLAPSPETLYPFKSGNSAIVVYPKSKDPEKSVDPERAVSFEFKPETGKHCTFDVTFDKRGHAYVATAGGSYKDPKGNTRHIRSSVYKFKFNGKKIERLAQWRSDTNEALRAIQVTKKGEVLVGATLTRRVIRLTNNLKYKGEYTNHTNRPWGLCLDAEGTIYTGNFGRELPDERDDSPRDPSEVFHNGVTVIRNENDRDARLMTLPTGGDEVMLRNGFPLYGMDNVPCYSPLMRQTSVTPDRVGNLWTVNNWKPNFKIDLTENPPGDGVIVFVGVAAPTPPH